MCTIGLRSTALNVFFFNLKGNKEKKPTKLVYIKNIFATLQKANISLPSTSNIPLVFNFEYRVKSARILTKQNKTKQRP